MSFLIEQSCNYKTETSSQKKNYKDNKSNEYIINNKYNFFISPSQLKLPHFRVPKTLIHLIMNNLKPFPNMTKESNNFLKILHEIKNTDGFQLNEGNYLEVFKLMLYIEEIQNNLNMKKYDKKQTIIKILNSNYSIKIYLNLNELIEEGLLIKCNDIVEIHDLETKMLFKLEITDIMNDHIIGICNKRVWNELITEKLYTVRFRFNNYPLKCCHYALSLINLYKLTPHFFPVKRNTRIEKESNHHWFNKRIQNNPEQKQAILNIICKSSFPAPYILYGPPGTGKTCTLVEAICQIWHNNPAAHILVCASSNIAADVITKRLLQYIPKNNLHRMYSPSKERSHIDVDIAECSNYFQGKILMLPKEVVLLKSIIISTLCTSLRLLFLKLNESHFSYVFIDEAGQVTEPDSMIPFSLLSSTKEGRIGYLHGQVIIAGDPQQLGPGISSKIAEPILGKSILERLMNCEPYKKNEYNKYNPCYITKLLQNYRSHPIIIHVSNKLFYDNELKACEDDNIRRGEDWKHLLQPKFPIIFHGVKGIEIKSIQSTSPYNIEEIKIVVHYVKILIGQKLKESTVTESDIGIITPFVQQKRKIDKALEKEMYNNIDVGTVEFFQGQEKNIIILSLVRNKTFLHNKQYHIGFLSNPKRLNVALTRAKILLIIIGNPLVLMTEKHWCYLLKYCKRNNACCGINFNLQNEIVDEI